MSPDRVRDLLAATGRSRRAMARLLGYSSESSLRQAEYGRQTIPEPKALWLERYAQLRAKHIAAEEGWLINNPPPL
jgi:hypothetical protein